MVFVTSRCVTNLARLFMLNCLFSYLLGGHSNRCLPSIRPSVCLSVCPVSVNKSQQWSHGHSTDVQIPTIPFRSLLSYYSGWPQITYCTDHLGHTSCWIKSLIFFTVFYICRQ